MASPLIGIAGVNSLLFAAYGISKRIISPFPQLSLPQIAAAGAMAGAANAILASPGLFPKPIARACSSHGHYVLVEMFKVRMQGQYGSKDDKRLRQVVREEWSKYGFRNGIMRGYWVRAASSDVTSFRSPCIRSLSLEKSRHMQGTCLANA